MEPLLPLLLSFGVVIGDAPNLCAFAVALRISSAVLRNWTKAAATLPFGKLDGLSATAGVEEADNDETSVEADADDTIGAINTGVERISFLAVAWLDDLNDFLYDGIVNDCSGDAMPLLVADGAAVTEPPNVVCTKFDEFLNNFVKLLVLNDNKPFGADAAAAAVGGSATGDVTLGSDLIRMDFVFWLNIILTSSIRYELNEQQHSNTRNVSLREWRKLRRQKFGQYVQCSSLKLCAPVCVCVCADCSMCSFNRFFCLPNALTLHRSNVRSLLVSPTFFRRQFSRFFTRSL